MRIWCPIKPTRENIEKIWKIKTEGKVATVSWKIQKSLLMRPVISILLRDLKYGMIWTQLSVQRFTKEQFPGFRMKYLLSEMPQLYVGTLESRPVLYVTGSFALT